MGAAVFIVAPMGQKQFEVALRNKSLPSCKFRESMVWSLKVTLLLQPLHMPATSSKIRVLVEYTVGNARSLERFGMNDFDGAGDTVGALDIEGDLVLVGNGATSSTKRCRDSRKVLRFVELGAMALVTKPTVLNSGLQLVSLFSYRLETDCPIASSMFSRTVSLKLSAVARNSTEKVV